MNYEATYLVKLEGIVTAMGGVVPPMTTPTSFEARSLQLLDAISAASGGGFTFDQTAEPVGPTAGQTWRERSAGGLILGQWEWSGSLWIAIAATSLPFSSVNGASPFNSISLSTSRFVQMPFLRAVAVSICSSAFLNPIADSSNRWDIATGFGEQTAFGPAITVTGNFSLNAPVVRIARIDALSGISNGTSENCFHVEATRVGDPSSLFFGAAVLVKQVRQ